MLSVHHQSVETRKIKHAEQRHDFTALEQLTSQNQQHVPRVELSPPRLRCSDWHTRAIRNDDIVENEVVSFRKRGKTEKCVGTRN